MESQYPRYVRTWEYIQINIMNGRNRLFPGYLMYFPETLFGRSAVVNAKLIIWNRNYLKKMKWLPSCWLNILRKKKTGVKNQKYNGYLRLFVIRLLISLVIGNNAADCGITGFAGHSVWSRKNSLPVESNMDCQTDTMGPYPEIPGYVQRRRSQLNLSSMQTVVMVIGAVHIWWLTKTLLMPVLLRCIVSWRKQECCKRRLMIYEQG